MPPPTVDSDRGKHLGTIRPQATLATGYLNVTWLTTSSLPDPSCRIVRPRRRTISRHQVDEGGIVPIPVIILVSIPIIILVFGPRYRQTTPRDEAFYSGRTR
ncbi:hypothetical protein [Haladaptatus sp. R4]|uniref:hypothetical protein n=1 Tax=Haladaptatus sp. R4 TaxID=1679489 RepID=UPI000A8C5CB2|nr:hypothetical protein [Haladaptatus sp. R4]